MLIHVALCCRVVDAPWRHPGADVSAFFNYDHSMRTWRDYCKKVEQYRLQFTMQKKIQTLDATSMADPSIDPDLPPELRAALAAERREQPAPPPRRPYSAHGIIPLAQPYCRPHSANHARIAEIRMRLDRFTMLT